MITKILVKRKILMTFKIDSNLNIKNIFEFVLA